MNDVKIYVDAGADRSAPINGKHRQCAYTVVRTDGRSESRFYGLGHLRDMSVAIAEGIIAALMDLLPEALESAPELLPNIEIICGSPGFWNRLVQTCEVEILDREHARGLDQQDSWKKLAVLAAVFRLPAPRKATGPSEERALLWVQKEREKLSKEALSKVSLDASGITECWRKDLEFSA
ncbi:hypothetical protein E0H56_04395 [Rhizobium leguminosarum bv. viciae]|uniref:hypothetical protein n=1 Tax=Rhizobium leguminosarum TaxID=384 RepID=UPI00103881F1|nr:hypothetical protein [Rhizobium leguminosarum]TBZ96338.1 hypothetical protein E0H56_04395 [Rhizobium leguminosarum bv. viciae]